MNLANELNILIFSFLDKRPDHLTIKNLKENTLINLKLFLLFRINKSKLNDNKIIFKLLKKYDYYQEYYDNICPNLKNIITSPILIDALFTECNLPYCYSTFEIFNNEILEDIKTIINLLPESINSTYGQMRCRINVTPLLAACYNINIPLSIIELLVSNGANINHKINVNGYDTDILSDLEDNNCFRLKEIKKIFESQKLK